MLLQEILKLRGSEMLFDTLLEIFPDQINFEKRSKCQEYQGNTKAIFFQFLSYNANCN